MLEKNINSPWCSSAGRLFDAVASILSLREKVHYEGQAAMELEFLTDGTETNSVYDFNIVRHGNDDFEIDWTEMIKQIIKDKNDITPIQDISKRFHNTLVRMILEIAKISGEKIVALSGGCFQNKYLLENSITTLKNNGFEVFWNREVPPNDGGISLGQIAYLSYFKIKK